MNYIAYITPESNNLGIEDRRSSMSFSFLNDVFRLGATIATIMQPPASGDCLGWLAGVVPV